MNQTSRVILLCLVAALPAWPQAPAGAKREYLDELEHASKQVVALAEAMPAEKYGWRPGKGVRTVSEVYMHIATGNFLLLDMAGAKPPEGLYKLAGKDHRKEMMAASQEMEKTVTEKARVVAVLKQSLDAVRGAFEEANLDKPVKFFGRDSKARAIYLRILVHVNEHMGQSVAYARMNGVVPPWSQ